MNLKERMQLDIGDQVFWADPDESLCSGYCKIVDIITPSKRVENLSSVLILENDMGGIAEAYVCEVA